jgi:hypothetical protein
MQRQHWRWLWIWVGVLVAGCGQIWSSDRTPPPARETALPLFGYTLLPPSLTPSAWPVSTATPLFAVDGSGALLSPLAVYLAVTGPACYETPVNSLICLGQVRNTLDVPVEQVVVAVQLLARDGTPLAAHAAYLSRWMLPSGLAGPYSVLFETIPDGYAGAYAFVVSGQVAQNADGRYAHLTLRQISGSFVIDQYQVALSIVNESQYAVEQVVVTMTLLDRYGQVTGFRQVYLDGRRQLKPGEALAVTIKVIPQGPNTVAFDVFAEGRFAAN